MAASSPSMTTSDKRKSAEAEEAVTEARDALAGTVDTVKRQAETVGERVPEVLDACAPT